MAATTTSTKQNRPTKVIQNVQKEVKPAQAFFTKFNNDWVLNFSGALAYSLLMSMFPIAIGLLSILGFFLGSLGAQAQDQLIQTILHVLPSQNAISASVVQQINTQLAKNAGILGIIAVILALFNGSRLFIQIEAFFSIIYHVRQRSAIKQNVMAFGMLFLFAVLIPIMTLAAAAPAFILTILKPTPLGQIPGISIFLSIVAGLIVAFILFMAIYMVVPNQHISPRKSWLGAVVAAIALQIYLTFFPLYVTHFLNSYVGPISLLILLIFFYYFAVILLLGAEVNAFFSEGIKATPTNLVTMVHLTTSHLPKDRQKKQEQAAQSHKDKPIDDVAEKAGIVDIPEADTGDVHEINARKPAEENGEVSSSTVQDTHDNATNEQGQAAKKEQKKPTTSKTAVVAETVAGTGLAFLFEMLRLRRQKPQ
ncbi:MAG TPA: YihY/virulence factor BrkB family protein [Ktedonobacteraceae bacterium]|nr:YihY/virulence factor BrkB family protein [Ktedonobacteraceae bacterium]